MYDCLHLTQNSQLLVARAFAKALMGGINDQGNGQRIEDVSLVNTGVGGWVTASIAKYRRLSDRTVNINMQINSPDGAAHSNVQVAQLPRVRWSRKGQSFVIACDGTQTRVTIDVSGIVKVYGLNSGNFIHICVTYCV